MTVSLPPCAHAIRQTLPSEATADTSKIDVRLQTTEGKDYLIVYPSREAKDSRPTADPPGVEVGPKGLLTLNGEPFQRSRFRPATIDTYDDHRMAMAFALAACSGHPVTINDPGCVRKTYPYYFKVLQGVGRFGDTEEEQ